LRNFKICSIKGCSNYVYSKGLCKYHYYFEHKPKKKKSQPKIVNFNAPIDLLQSFKIIDLRKIADYEMRKYLLRKAKRNGRNQIYCPLKKKWFHENSMEASHFIDRAKYQLRYDLDNVHLISSVSNSWDSKVVVEGYKSLHHKEYSEFLGEEIVNKLEEKSKEKFAPMQKKDYIAIIKNFREN
jgi:hypothetical protein